MVNPLDSTRRLSAEYVCRLHFCIGKSTHVREIDDWRDNARDILNFLLYHIPRSSQTGSLPLYLPTVPVEISQQRQSEGFADRTFVVVGHSFGGASAILAALHSPQLFNSLILVDPVVESTHIDLRTPLTGGALRRRTHWPSRFVFLRHHSFSPLTSVPSVRRPVPPSRPTRSLHLGILTCSRPSFSLALFLLPMEGCSSRLRTFKRPQRLPMSGQVTTRSSYSQHLISKLN